MGLVEQLVHGDRYKVKEIRVTEFLDDSVWGDDIWESEDPKVFEYFFSFNYATEDQVRFNNGGWECPWFYVEHRDFVEAMTWHEDGYWVGTETISHPESEFGPAHLVIRTVIWQRLGETY